jgi:hypothetical protein
MKMAPAEQSVHRHDHSAPGVSKTHPNCQCPIATSGVAVASLINLSIASLVPVSNDLNAPNQVDHFSNLNSRSESERGPPVFLQS